MATTQPPEVPTGLADLMPEEPVDWALLVLEIILGVLILAGNLLVIVSILAAKVLRHSRNYFILSLAVADLIVGVVVVPIKALQTGDPWNEDLVECEVWAAVDILASCATMLSLTMISLDRYVAILHPLFYKVQYTGRKVIGAVCFIWITSITAAITYWWITHTRPDTADPDKPEMDMPTCIEVTPPGYQLAVALSAFVPIGLMVYIHAKIWVILTQQHAKTVERRKRSERTESANESTVQSIINVIQEKKGWITTALVLGSFVSCFVPFFLYLIIDSICRLAGGVSTVSAWTYNIFAWIGYFHSSLNPVIYTLFNDDFYFVFKEIVCCRCCTLNEKARNELYSRQVANSDSVVSTVAPSPEPIEVGGSTDSIASIFREQSCDSGSVSETVCIDATTVDISSL